MGLIPNDYTDFKYYAGSERFIVAATPLYSYTVTLYESPLTKNDIRLYINEELIDDGTQLVGVNLEEHYTLSNNTLQINSNLITLESQDEIIVALKEKKYGNYRYTSLADVVNNFMVGYVGDGKIINRAKRTDVLFHTKRAIQEFAFDIIKVEKIQEVEVGPSLSIPMPKDYVNYVAISYIDNQGIEHPLPRGRFTSKPSEAIAQDSDFNYTYDNEDGLITTTSITDDKFTSLDFNSFSKTNINDNFFYNSNYPGEKVVEFGKRFGGDPEEMNANGYFIINENSGTIHFTSNLIGSVITIKYISDGLGTDKEMKVHKLAEEAIYKYVAHAILSSMTQVPEYIVNRFRRERRAAMRNAKLRLYDLKLPELTQVMRGKSKQIKH